MERGNHDAKHRKADLITVETTSRHQLGGRGTGEGDDVEVPEIAPRPGERRAAAIDDRHPAARTS